MGLKFLVAAAVIAASSGSALAQRDRGSDANYVVSEKALDNYCLWNGKLFSLESYFCAAKSVALVCRRSGSDLAKWVQERAVPCDLNQSPSPP